MFFSWWIVACILINTYYFLFFQVCQNGTYGENCTGVCGHCLGGSPCNKTDGACPGGCQHPWIGTRCDQKEGLGTK